MPKLSDCPDAQKAVSGLLKAVEEVKAHEAQRQRLGQLQVAYGNALIAARGFGAPETTEAFSKARESAVGDRVAPERLAADYGLWVGSFVRGELSAMRACAKAFLSDVAASPDSPETGVARRIAGTTHWFAGEYRQAREHLERTLALFEAGSDDDLAFRFGQDAGVAAALTRSERLKERSLMAHSGLAPTPAFCCLHRPYRADGEGRQRVDSRRRFEPE